MIEQTIHAARHILPGGIPKSNQFEEEISLGG